MSTEPVPKGPSPWLRPFFLAIVAAGILVGVCCGLYVMMPQYNGREDMARAKIRGLTQAIETYKLNNGNYPTRLEELAKPQPNGGPPLIQADALLDPWGQPYGYDPTGPANGGRKPDIWCTPPSRRVGNWPTAK